MYKYDRNRQTFNLINALQPVYRNNGGGLFEFDRRKQHETADLIFEELDEAVNINSFRIFKDDNTGGFDFYLFSVLGNNAELVQINLDASNIHLQDIFERSTGLCLSY